MAGTTPEPENHTRYPRASAMNAATSAETLAASQPSSDAISRATSGAIAVAARALRNSARVRRARTSSTVRAIS